MAIRKKDVGEVKFRWCMFIRKEFSLTDKIAEELYDRYIKKYHKLPDKDGNTPDIEHLFPTRDLDYLWLGEAKKDVLKIVLDTRGFGLQAYLRMIYGFRLPLLTKDTMYIISREFIKNDTDGSTIMKFQKYLDYVKKTLREYSEQYNQNIGKLDDKNILELSISDDIILLDKGFNILKTKNIVNNENLLNEVAYITTAEAFNIEKFLYYYLSMQSLTEFTQITEDLIKEVIDSAKFTPNGEQSSLLWNFRNSGFNILNGIGGTGKSYTMKLALDILDKAGYTCMLLTPTGISSKVLSKYTGKFSSTIHRWYYSKKAKGEVLNFEDTDVLILDECSMLGLDHWKMITEGIQNTPPDCYPKMFMIGDTGQLQAISAGAFFRDFIDLVTHKIIKGNLTSLKTVMRAREDSFISHCSNYFALDKSAVSQSLYNNQEKGVYMIPLDDSLQEMEDITKFIFNYVENMGMDWEETTIIIPQRVGNKGTNEFNKHIMKLLSNKYKDAFKPIGMVLTNNYKQEVFNGEKFRIEQQTLVKITQRRDKNGELVDFPIYEYEVTMLDDGTKKVFETGEVDWEIAYANTVHKLQGCTVKNVIFLCSRTHTFMLTKQLVYTGLSRASDTITCLYDKYTFENARLKDVRYDRITFLGETLKKKLYTKK